ncbi:MAG: DNA-processing protein DprA [Clostridia bacterium]|nr:DNA-processing protein DprA [Clostridia bacterium]
MFEKGTEGRYWLWIHRALGVAAQAFYLLLSEYETAQAAYEAVKSNNIKPGSFATQRVIDKLKAGPSEMELDDYIARVESLGIKMLLSCDDDYPMLLKHIFDSPPVLYYKGVVETEPELPIAVIGARKCTDYGRKVARIMSKQLADLGARVVSGLAYGIDAEASRGALRSSSDNCTIAVLGSSIDRIYPKTNERLAAEIVERGALVSEFPPGYPTLTSNFPMRNRIISGLSKGVLVVEAGFKSGTSITVDAALDQGRDVFCVPGRITDPQSAGTNKMIREGTAKAVFGVNDILEEYGLHADSRKAVRKELRRVLDKQAYAVYSILCTQPCSFDELCMITGIAPPVLNCVLTELEFSSLISQSPGRVYTVQ